MQETENKFEDKLQEICLLFSGWGWGPWKKSGPGIIPLNSPSPLASYTVWKSAKNRYGFENVIKACQLRVLSLDHVIKACCHINKTSWIFSKKKKKIQIHGHKVMFALYRSGMQLLLKFFFIIRKNCTSNLLRINFFFLKKISPWTWRTPPSPSLAPLCTVGREKN